MTTASCADVCGKQLQQQLCFHQSFHSRGFFTNNKVRIMFALNLGTFRRMWRSTTGCYTRFMQHAMRSHKNTHFFTLCTQTDQTGLLLNVKPYVVRHRMDQNNYSTLNYQINVYLYSHISFKWIHLLSGCWKCPKPSTKVSWRPWVIHLVRFTNNLLPLSYSYYYSNTLQIIHRNQAQTDHLESTKWCLFFFNPIIYQILTIQIQFIVWVGLTLKCSSLNP